MLYLTNELADISSLCLLSGNVESNKMCLGDVALTQINQVRHVYPLRFNSLYPGNLWGLMLKLMPVTKNEIQPNLSTMV